MKQIVANNRWLSKYKDGGDLQEHQSNFNDSHVSFPPNFIGDGYINTPNRYNSSWNGQFQMGGSLPGSVGFMYARTGSIPSNGKYTKKTKPSAQKGKNVENTIGDLPITTNEANTFDSLSNKLRDIQYNETQDFKKTHPDVPIDDILSKQVNDKTFKNSKLNQIADSLNTVHGTKSIPASQDFINSSSQYQDLLNSLGYTQKVKGSNEEDLKNFGWRAMLYKYVHPQDQPAYKTIPNMQNGGEMQFYQNGLDWKPKTISQDGSTIPSDATRVDNPSSKYTPIDNQLTNDDINKYFPNKNKYFDEGNPIRFRDRINGHYPEPFKNIKTVTDDSSMQTYGDDNSKLGYLRNAGVTENAKLDIIKYAKQYNLDPNLLLSTLSIERPNVYANIYANTHDLGTKMLEKVHIPTYSLDKYGNKDRVNIIDLAKNAGAYMKDGTINNKKLENKIKQWTSDFDKIDSTLNTIESPIQAHAMFISQFGLNNVNSKQQELPGVKEDYPTMVKRGADYIRSKKLFGTKENGGIIKDNNGYWNPNNWGHPVEINSNDITMHGVKQNLLGISNEGDTKLMTPNKNYKFRGKKVIEYPIAENGKQLKQLDMLTNFNNFGQSKKNWLSKYQ